MTHPVGAADLAVLVRETVRAVTARTGMRAAFAPKVLAGGVGNGGHVHLSLWRDGVSLISGGPGPCGLTRESEGFAAGILTRLPALLAAEAAALSLIDEYRVRVYPVLVGGGIAFFPHRERRVDLELVETRTFSSKVVYLRYRVTR